MKLLEEHYKAITGKIHPSILKDLLPMEITPAAKWFLAESDKEHWEYTDDFPCIVPPSPLTWLEYEAPDRISSSERTVINSVLRRCGCLALTLEVQPEARPRALSDDLLLPYMQSLDGESRKGIDWAGDRSLRQSYIEKAQEAALLPRWITIWNIVLMLHTGELVTLGLYGLYLDEQGRVIAGLNACITAMPASFYEDAPADYDVFSDALPFMFALSLTHCRNVTMSDMAVPAAVAKKRAKKGTVSLTFKVLDIKPMRQKLARPTKGGSSDTKNAMHFVRGHMKHFSAEKPLFGKHTGTYWWNLSVRGDEAVGTASKEYQVHPQ